MKERPIPFRPEMVRAILDGKKTQTRRVIEPQPGPWEPNDAFLCWRDREPLTLSHIEARCRYGVPGDRLWVREAWRIVGWHEGQPLWIEYAAGGHGEPSTDRWPEWPDEDKDIALRIQCDEDCKKAGLTLNADDEYAWPEGQSAPTRWRPAMFMPRALCRLTLEITNIRVQRLHEITREDVLAEGVAPSCETKGCSCWLDNFRVLWGQINGGESWASNPWVWAISFRKAA